MGKPNGGVGTSATFTDTNQAEFVARRLLQAAGLAVDHSFIYEFRRQRYRALWCVFHEPDEI